MSDVAAGPPPPTSRWPRHQVALGAWLLLMVLAILLVGLGPRSLARTCGQWLRTLWPAWAVVVAALATARLPGVGDEAERPWLTWARDVGLLGCASLVGITAFTVVDVSKLPEALQFVLSVTLFMGAGGSLLGALVAAEHWGVFAFAVARLPRRSTREEVVRAAHVAAPLITLALLVTSGLSRRSDLTTGAVVVPARIAVGLTLSGFVLIFALWLRLRARPPAE